MLFGPALGPTGREQHLSVTDREVAGVLAAAAVDRGAVAVSVADTGSSSGALRLSILWPPGGNR